MQPSNILNFWFNEISSEQWFKKDLSFDEMLHDRFIETYGKATKGELDFWSDTPQGLLALVIILDQFSRNLFRDSPSAFAMDKKALELAKKAIEKGYDQLVETSQKTFLYMPFMHSESLEAQEQGVLLFSKESDENGLDYMLQHRNIIAKFGRFPHRNSILGRKSTPEELEFLNQPGSSF